MFTSMYQKCNMLNKSGRLISWSCFTFSCLNGNLKNRKCRAFTRMQMCMSLNPFADKLRYFGYISRCSCKYEYSIVKENSIII